MMAGSALSMTGCQPAEDFPLIATFPPPLYSKARTLHKLLLDTIFLLGEYFSPNNALKMFSTAEDFPVVTTRIYTFLCSGLQEISATVLRLK